ncbi:MAG: endopeptidase La [Gemmatimonadetes bacterium]|nr:endopeptidase La [Gemmatimonadota bacterium]
MSDENTSESIEVIDRTHVPGEVPVLRSKEVVIFPYMLSPLLIESEQAIRAVDTAVNGGHRVVALFGQKPGEKQGKAEPDDEAGDAESEIQAEDLYQVGTAVQVVRMQRTPDNKLQVLVNGIARVGLEELVQTTPYPLARVRVLEGWAEKTNELEALSRNVLGLFKKAMDLVPNVPKELMAALDSLSEQEQKADFIASQFNIRFEERQEVLSELNLRLRFELIHKFLTREVEILELRQKIESDAAGSMDEAQREYFLRQQLRAIREELGEGGDEVEEVEELSSKIEAAGMPDEARKAADRELSRMEKMPGESAEYTVSRTYLDWLVELPWSKASEDRIDVDRAQKILDNDHYGIEKPKDRILEYLAVRGLKNDMRGPILCLVGPPGTGKTSLGRSVARALDRTFVRISLGGVRDESEVRGHRRTYVGALPGRIIQGLRRAGTNNPVFMLDEIDKLGADFRGDPSAALLEVLDPEQNCRFEDHYLDVPFDLSQVMFIATANTLHTIPPALLDRMEVLELPGYTEQEKLQIARNYLVPRQLEEHGLTARRLEIDTGALTGLIRYYTSEAGLRNLERAVGTLCRKVARRFAQGRKRKMMVKPGHLQEYLGPRQFQHEIAEDNDEVGVAAGLAVTSAGGDVMFVEATLMPGGGNLNLTGQVGDVMQESVQAAMTYVRTRWESLGLEEKFNEGKDVHVHAPAGAVPKDGPSAGITMAAVLASVFTGRPVRKEVAMTGEITLRGKVLPVGGIRDKVLAAHRAGIRIVILPEKNRKDLEEVPDTVRKDVKLVFADHMDKVLDTALTRKRRTPSKRRSGTAGSRPSPRTGNRRRPAVTAEPGE